MTDTAAATGQQASTTDAGTAAATDQQAAGTAAATTAASTAATDAGQQAQGGDQQQSQAIDTTGWPQAAIDALSAGQRQIADLRRERGDERMNAKAQAAQDGARKAIADAAKLAGLEIPGLTDEDNSAADPKALAGQITELTGERDGARTAQAITDVAWEQGVDRTKLGYLNYQLSQDATLKGLDGTTAEGRGKISAAVAALVAADSTLKLTGSAQAGGVEQLAGSGTADEISQEAFNSMSMLGRAELNQRDPAAYQRLVAGQTSRI